MPFDAPRFALPQAAGELAARLWAPIPLTISAAAEKFLGVDELRDWTHELAECATPELFCEHLRAKLDLRLECSESDAARLPAAVPSIVVANHSFGLADAVILGCTTLARRSDVRFLANHRLTGFDLVREMIFPVDLEDTPEARRTNSQAIRRSISWLENGGMLVIFPAGEVAHWRWDILRIQKSEWRDTVVRLSLKTRAPITPVHVDGGNSALFHAAGAVHPELRTLLLVTEFLRLRSRRVRVRIGKALPPAMLERRGGTAAEWLPARCLALGTVAERSGVEERPEVAPARSGFAAEIAALPESCRLSRGSELETWLFRGAACPNALREIGRLREITFRAAGEGTGRSIDLDAFDRSFEHLVLWNPHRLEIAGAYRLSQSGGSYTATQFELRPEFFTRLGAALELGRSFIRAEYQRRYEALLLLWKGIGAYLRCNPHLTKLYGPVSISNIYTPAARATLARSLERVAWHAELAPHAAPRCPFRGVGGITAFDLEELDALVSEMEPDGKGTPVLLKHYLKLGGRIACWSVDRDFGNSLDGLMIVDLATAPKRQLRRYIGD